MLSSSSKKGRRVPGSDVIATAHWLGDVPLTSFIDLLPIVTVHTRDGESSGGRKAKRQNLIMDIPAELSMRLPVANESNKKLEAEVCSSF